MVKGISRQVIVVHSPDQKLFEQAIFILKDNALKEGGITDEALLREANRLLHSGKTGRKRMPFRYGALWATCGAAATAAAWIITVFF